MNVFVTGCDDNTVWQLPWFLHHFRSHCDGHLVLADFGISDDRIFEYFDGVITVEDGDGWFKKPTAIMKTSQVQGVTKTCWIDTDCEIKSDPSDIFDLSEKEMLGMVEDRPWTERRGEYGPWYNSGVVLVEGTPRVLREWANECISDPRHGDQEVLYEMIGGDGIKRLGWINPLPHKYNTLRLDYLDEIAVKNPAIVHHTGIKGKNKIQIDIAKGDIDELFN